MLNNLITMITVTDMDRSVGFYRDTLGLKLKFQSPDWSEFDFGSNTLALHGGGVPAPPPSGKQQLAGRASIGFTVENLDRVFEELKAKGATVVMPPMQREGEGIRLAVFLDPDGLPVSFAQTV